MVLGMFSAIFATQDRVEDACPKDDAFRVEYTHVEGDSCNNTRRAIKVSLSLTIEKNQPKKHAASVYKKCTGS